MGTPSRAGLGVTSGTEVSFPNSTFNNSSAGVERFPSTEGGGGFMQTLPLLAAGAGAAISTFGDQGSAPQQRIGLSPGGQKLEANVFAGLNRGLPQNLASRYLGEAKRIAQSNRRRNDRMNAAASVGQYGRFGGGGGGKFGGGGASGAFPVSGDEGNVTSSRGLTQLLAQNQERLGDATRGPQSVGQARLTHGMTNLQNLNAFASQQLQLPVNIAQNQAASQQYDQLVGARRGAALGSLAELAGASYFYA